MANATIPKFAVAVGTVAFVAITAYAYIQGATNSPDMPKFDLAVISISVGLGIAPVIGGAAGLAQWSFNALRRSVHKFH